MRDLLTKYNIPFTNLASAVAFLNEADESVIEGFNREFGITTQGNDALASARFAADAVLRGASNVSKVVEYVGKKMLGMTVPVAPKPASVLVVGEPIVDTPTVTVTPVEFLPVESAVAPLAIKGKPGRKRLGNSDMCKAVAAIEAAPKDAHRADLLKCIIAAGVKQSSAVVYLWRYNKGERQ